VAIGLALGAGVVLAWQVRSRADLGDRKWAVVGAGVSGAVVGAGAWRLWRQECRWRLAIGQYWGEDNDVREVAFPLEPNSNRIYQAHTRADRRVMGVKVLIGSPLIIGRKVAGDALALLGSTVGLRDEFWSDLEMLGRDVVHAVALPLGGLITVFFPWTGQAFLADLARWSNRIDSPQEVQRRIPRDMPCIIPATVACCVTVFPLMPACCQPMIDIEHPHDQNGNPADVQAQLIHKLKSQLGATRYLAHEVIRELGLHKDPLALKFDPKLTFAPGTPWAERVNLIIRAFREYMPSAQTDGIAARVAGAFDRRRLATLLIMHSGPINIEIAALADQFTFGDNDTMEEKMMNAVVTLLRLIGPGGRQQLVLNYMAKHNNKNSRPAPIQPGN
jgi:hypothetical protein